MLTAALEDNATSRDFASLLPLTIAHLNGDISALTVDARVTVDIELATLDRAPRYPLYYGKI